MGSFGNDDREFTSTDNNPDTDFRCDETQPFDSQFSPSFLPGLTGENDRNYGDGYDSSHLNTIPFDYDFCAEDDSGTAVVNLTGETQERDLSGETQERDFAGETQVMDLAGETQAWDDFDCGESVDTQLMDDDGERTDKTEILASADELSDDDSRKVCYQVMAGKNLQFETDYNKQSTSSVVAPRFTYIRIQSLRQAALARRMVMNGSNGETCTTANTSHSSDQEPIKNNENTSTVDSNEDKIAQENQQDMCNQIKSKSNCSTARKLCFESLSGSKDNDVEELNKFPALDCEMTGLSYVDSQEPGDLSQENALDFVERFLQDNVTEFDVDAGSGKNVLGDSKLTPASRGQQDLAKRASKRREVSGMGVFDWDDNHEDEGGGDIFVRRKEEFFGSDNHRRKSFSFPQRTKAAKSNQVRDEEQKNTVKKNKLLHSDSRVVLHNLKGNDLTMEAGSMKLRRNLVNELDQHAGIDSSIQCEGSEAVRNAQDLSNVGPDTQIAAETMEALFNGEGMVNNGTDYTDHIPKNNLEDHPKSCPVGKTKSMVGSRHLCSKRNLNSSGRKKGDEVLPENILGRKAVTSKRNPTKKQNNFSRFDRSNEGKFTNKRCLQGKVGEHTPIAYRTRRSSVGDQLVDTASREERKRKRRIDSIEERENFVKAVQPMQRLANEFSEAEMTTMNKLGQSDSKASAKSSHNITDLFICPRRRRSQRIRLGNVRGPGKLYDSSPQSGGHKVFGRSVPISKRKWTETRSTCFGSRKSCSIQSSTHEYQENDNFCDAADKDRNLNFNADSHADCFHSAGSSKLITRSNKMQGDRYESSDLASASSADCKTPSNDASPVCMGNDYHKQSCKRKLARSLLLKELCSLSAASEPLTPTKDSRKRRDMTDIRVLFSQHLDDDIIKHQKKILARIGSSIASSITDATHFVADQFVRTRNMLEAIASGKPVVTHLWLESCGQASCFIDERNYILRDAKKEKELGFSMPVSLARAGKHPLLEGRRVLITPNTEPSKEIISSLVKAVQGQAVERIGRNSVKDDKIPDDLLVLSCENDFDACVPFLRKGGAVYSSELLLNGIVTQKLEYGRHLLFADNVKRTRSTIWLREDGHSFQPVTKCK